MPQKICPAWFRVICWSVLLAFGGNTVGVDILNIHTAYAQDASAPNALMPPPGRLLEASPRFVAPELKAISVDPLDPCKFKFLVNAADDPHLDQEQIERLAKYFLTFLAIPEEDLWVNLSPYEANRILNQNLESTIVGRDMLILDYMLKQMAASMTYPEREPGRTFWKKMLAKAGEKYRGYAPMDMISKVWIVPEKAVVYERDGSAFIAESRLKVMLEKDYLAQKMRGQAPTANNALESTLLKEIILPELEREVNEGREFAPLRQMFHSLILAIWFKRRLKEHLVNKVFADQKKTFGIAVDEKNFKEKIYGQYLEAFKKGVYNYIREDRDQSGGLVPRKYFSGGVVFNARGWAKFLPVPASPSEFAMLVNNLGKRLYSVDLALLPKGISRQKLFAAALAATIFVAPLTPLAIPADKITAPPRAAVVENIGPQMVQIKIQKEQVSRASKIRMSAKEKNDVFRKMKDIVKVEDVVKAKKLNSRQAAYLRANWDKIFESSQLRKSRRLVTETAQGILGVRIDGVIGPQTGAAVNNRKAMDAFSSTKAGEANGPAIKAAGGGPEKVSSKDGVDKSAAGQMRKLAAKAPEKSDVLPGSGGGHGGSVKSEGEAAKNPARPAVPHTSTDATARVQIDARGVFTISGNASVVPVREKLFAGAAGIMRGFDPDVRVYPKNAKVAQVDSLSISGKIEDKKVTLKLATEDLKRKEKLHKSGAATAAEVLAARNRAITVKREADELEQSQEVRTVRTPHAGRVHKTLVRDGQHVDEKTEILELDNLQVVNLTVRAPTGMTSFEKIGEFTLNGEKVKIAGVEWKEQASDTEVLVTFKLVSPRPVPTERRVPVYARLHPSENRHVQLAGMRGTHSILSSVKAVQRVKFFNPEDSNMKYHVDLGDRVQAGQLLAESTMVELLFQEYQQRVLAYNVLQEQMDQMSGELDGIPYVLNRDKDRLREQMDMLAGNLSTLATRISNLQIIASEDGIVTRRAGVNNPKGTVILELQTRKAVVGSTESIETGPTLSGQSALQEGSPVAVVTKRGNVMPGRITSINRMAGSGFLRFLRPQETFEVMVEDTGFALGEGQPVQVRVLTKEEAARIASVLQDGENHRAEEQRRAQAARARPLPLKYQTRPPARISFPLQPVRFSPSRPHKPVGPSLSLADLRSQIIGNQYLSHPATIAVQMREAEAEMVNPTKISLQANIFLRAGKVLFSGGLGGVFRNIIGGSIAMGNAYGAVADQLISAVWTQITDLLTDKPGKLKKLADTGVEASRWGLKTTLMGNINAADNLWTAVGAAQERAASLQSLKEDLEKAKKVLDKRAEVGEATVIEVRALAKKIEDVDTRIARCFDDMKRLTDALNHLRLEPLGSSFTPDIVWDGNFVSISAEQEQRMLRTLLSESYHIKQAEAEKRSMDVAIQMQKDGLLPAVNFTSLLISDDKTFNPIRDLTRGADLRTTAAQGHFTGGAGFELLLYDSTKRPLETIMRLEDQAARLRVSSAKHNEAQNLRIAVSLLNMASQEISRMEKLHEGAVVHWEGKAAQPDIYSMPDLVEERARIEAMGRQIIERKKDYFEQEAKLRELQVLDESLVKAKDVGAVRVSSAPPVTRSSGGMQLAMPKGVDDIVVRPSTPSAGGGPFFPAGAVTFQAAGAPDPNRAAVRLWLLMSGTNDKGPAGSAPSGPNNVTKEKLAGPIAEVARILISEPNELVRDETLQRLFKRQRNDPQFLQAVEEILLSSDYPEVIQQLWAHLANRNDNNIPLFIQMIHRAFSQPLPTIDSPRLSGSLRGQWGFQAIRDLIINSKDLNISEDVMFPFPPPKGTPDGQDLRRLSRRVWVSFLKRTDRLTAEYLLRSPYWDSDALAQIYWGLKMDNPQLDARDLAERIHKEIQRREYKRNAAKKFQAYESPDVYFWNDMRNDFRAVKLFPEEKRGIEISGIANNIELMSADVFRQAEAAANAVLERNRSRAEQFAFLFEVPDEEADQPALGRFAVLGPDDQPRPVSEAKDNVAQLRRILATGTSSAEEALDWLLKTREGIIQALQEYITNPKLKGTIEGSGWIDILQKLERKNTQETLIVRQASLDMYKASGNEQFLDIRLNTFDTYDEIRLAEDPRGKSAVDAYIEAKAIAFSLGYVKHDREKEHRFWTHSNQRFFTEVEENALDQIALKTRNSNPRDLKHTLGQLRGQPGLEIVEQVIKNAPRFEREIRENNQELPYKPLGHFIFPAAVGAIFITLFGFGRTREFFWRKKATPRQRVDRGLAHFGQGYQSKKTNGHSKLPKWSNLVRRNKGDPAMVMVDPGEGGPEIPANANFNTHLLAWKEELESLSHETAPRDVILAVNNMINSMSTIMILAPLTPELVSKNGGDSPARGSPEINNGDYIKGYAFFVFLGSHTLPFLAEYVERHKTLDESQRRDLKDELDTIMQMMGYVTDYLGWLDERGNLNTWIDHMYRAGHPLERLYRLGGYKVGIYPFIRGLQGYDYMGKKSVAAMRADRNAIIANGNRIIPGLYPDPEGFTIEYEKRQANAIKNVTSLVPSSSEGQADINRRGRFLTRLGAVAVPIALVSVLLWGPLINLSVPKLSVLGLIALLLSLWFHWDRNLNLLKMEYRQEWKSSFKAWENQFNAALGEVKSTVAQESQKLLAPERRRAKPTFDLIALIPASANDMDAISRVIKDPKFTAKYFHKKASVELFQKTRPGSANSIFEGVRFARAQLGARWPQARVLFVPIPQGIAEEDMVEAIGGAIMDGYWLASRKPGKEFVITYAQNKYSGPIPPPRGKADISLVAVRGKKKDLDEGFVRMGKNGKFRGTFEKLDLDEMQAEENNDILAEMKKIVDPTNPSIDQYPLSAGRLVMGARVSDIMEEMADAVETILPKELPVHLGRDFFNVIAQPTHDHVDRYLRKRARLPDLRKIYGDNRELRAQHRTQLWNYYEALFEAVSRAKGIPKGNKELVINVFAPHFKAAKLKIYTKSGNGDEVASPVTIPTVSPIPVNGKQPRQLRMVRREKAMVSPDGGLDLTATRNVVRIDSQQSDALPASKPNVVYDLQSFRGFEFELLQYRPMLNPIEFFVK